MNCPTCGTPVKSDQSFCRSCGARLSAVPNKSANPWAPMAPMAPLLSPPANTGGYLWSGILLIFVGTALGIIGKKLLFNDLLTTIGVLISLLGMFLTVLPYVRPPRQPRETASLDAANAEQDRAPTTRKLTDAPANNFNASVTERTTDLLESEPIDRKSAADGPDR